MKLTVTSSPHIRNKVNTRSIMLDVVIALLPALIACIPFWCKGIISSSCMCCSSFSSGMDLRSVEF